MVISNKTVKENQTVIKNTKTVGLEWDYDLGGRKSRV